MAATKTKYPSWVQTTDDRWESEEQRDGTPDFILDRVRNGWSLKWRTSAMRETFMNPGGRAAAMRSVADAVRLQAASSGTGVAAS